MRIVHTSDWHAGRLWKGIQRLPELALVLDGLAARLETQAVDLLLISGDVFDSGAPSAEAERIVFEFLRRIGRSGTRAVVIAGNHDSPSRLEAWGTLAELVGITVVARPQSRVVEVQCRDEKAAIAAIPFAGPRALIAATALEDEARAHATYADLLGDVFVRLSRGFRADTVNLFLAHTHLGGARIAGSERQVHLGEEWAASVERIPSTGQYAAFGHIHRPQVLEAARIPAEYAGSPLQMDFGEAGEEKSFVVLEITPGQPVARWREPYQGGIGLQKIQRSLAELEIDAERLRRAGWLEVTVPLELPDPDLAPKVKRLLPNAVAVRAAFAALPPEVLAGRGTATAPELFRSYYERTHGQSPRPELMTAFDALLLEVESPP